MHALPLLIALVTAPEVLPLPPTVPTHSWLNRKRPGTPPWSTAGSRRGGVTPTFWSRSKLRRHRPGLEGTAPNRTSRTHNNGPVLGARPCGNFRTR